MGVFLVGGCSRSVSDRDIRYVTSSEVAALIATGEEGVAILDARSEDEFAAGAIPGATHTPLPSVREDGPNLGLPAAARYVVYGRDPVDGRSIALTKRLLAIGHPTALLEGGYATWRARGLPVGEESSGQPPAGGAGGADAGSTPVSPGGIDQARR